MQGLQRSIVKLEPDNPQWAREFARDAYAALKQSLATTFANDRQSYTATKASLITDIIDKATR